MSSRPYSLMRPCPCSGDGRARAFLSRMAWVCPTGIYPIPPSYLILKGSLDGLMSAGASVSTIRSIS